MWVFKDAKIMNVFQPNSLEYDAVQPDYRLVAQSLERTWERLASTQRAPIATAKQHADEQREAKLDFGLGPRE